MSNDKDIVDRLDFIGLSSCYECGGNNTEYRLIQKAIKEIKFLRSEVERLRMTKEECYWLRKMASQVQSAGNADGATKVFDILKRLGGVE